MSLRNKRILVTCGPTWVAIDPVRILSNCSTGTLGQLLTKALTNAGAKVTLLEGPVSHPYIDKKARVIRFTYFNELKEIMSREIKKKYSAVIHAAAVADYQPKHFSNKKLSSNQKRMIVELIPTPKIIHLVKKISPETFLVGFKLEVGKNIAELKRKAFQLITRAHCNIVVANTVVDKAYTAFIIDQNKHVRTRAYSRQMLVNQLITILKNNL